MPTPDPIALPELPTKWRKKPVVIEARQLVRHEAECIAKWCDGQWLSLYGRGDNGEDISHVLIPTLEGAMRAEIGDWIIKGVKGEFYPCKPDIFAATYEPAGAAPSTPPLNELLGQPEEFNLNEVSGNPGQLASLEQRARELLAAEYRAAGMHEDAYPIACGGQLEWDTEASIRAITAALSAQPPSSECHWDEWIDRLAETCDRAADEVGLIHLPDGRVFGSRELFKAITSRIADAQATKTIPAAPQPREVQGVDGLVELARVLPMPDGYKLAQELPGIWGYVYVREDGQRMASGASWNHPALAAVAAWQDVATATTPQDAAGVEGDWFGEVLASAGEVTSLTTPPPGVDLEQFRELVIYWGAQQVMSQRIAEGKRLLAIIDSNPPGVDVGKLRELVASWQSEAGTAQRDGQHGIYGGMSYCADSLLAIIDAAALGVQS